MVDNLDMPQVAPQPELRAKLEQCPLHELVRELQERDPQSFATIDRNNPRRVIRALEVCIITGRPFSEQRGIAHTLYRCLLLGIQWPREVLYRRIDALGLEYRFIDRWRRGEFASEEQMVERLKYAIHDFTRRQLTWFRRDKRIVWIDGNSIDIMMQEAERIVEEFLS